MKIQIANNDGSGQNLAAHTFCANARARQAGHELRLSDDAVLIMPNSSDKLGLRLCRLLGVSCAKNIIAKFPNSETRIEVHESVRDKHVFVMARIAAPVNDALLETALLVQALKLADAQRITVILPYFPYSRQDRKADIRPPISARAVTDILKVVGAHQIVTVDLHATQVEGFFDGPFENLSGLNHFIPHILSSEGDDLVVVSPDAGGAKRAENFARKVEEISGKFTPLVVMSKHRAGISVPPKVSVSIDAQQLHGKTCLLIDDMIDTGGSIIAAAQCLKEKGAGRVVVCATHPVFSHKAVDRMKAAKTEAGEQAIEAIYVSDTLPYEEATDGFIKVISLAPLIAEAIFRLDQPRGTLRELKDRVDLGDDYATGE